MKEMKNYTIFCHGDCDGMISGSLALAANPGARIWLTNPVNLDNDLRKQRKHLDRIVITDIALNEQSLKEIFKEMKRLQKEGTEIIYIDSHPLPDELTADEIPADIVVYRDEGSASELTYLHYEEQLSWKHKYLAAVGSIGDYETETLFARTVMRDYDPRSIAFQSALLVQAIGEAPSINYLQFKKQLIERLALGIFPSELNNLVEQAVRASRVEHSVIDFVQKNVKKGEKIGYIFDLPTGKGFVGKGALFAATAAKKPVGVCGNSYSDKISMSIRRRDNKIDLNKITRIASKKANGSGGGHPSAAGATIKKKKIEEFLKYLDYEIEKINH
jgi:RecJ-like exonuclease